MDQASAQPIDPAEPVTGEGVQSRINELVAKQRQAEERATALQQQLMENTAQMAQMAMQRQQPVAPVAAPVDPLAQFKDSLDPVAHAAIQAAVNATRQQMEALYAPQFAQQAAQIAGFAVQSEAAAIPGLPREVAARAAQLAAQWRSAGINYPPGDAINFALGEYQRGQLAKAAPVAGYDPRNAGVPSVTQGYTPQPQTQARALPSNFDQLSRTQQNAALEANGVLDQPL